MKWLTLILLLMACERPAQLVGRWRVTVGRHCAAGKKIYGARGAAWCTQYECQRIKCMMGKYFWEDNCFYEVIPMYECDK